MWYIMLLDKLLLGTLLHHPHHHRHNQNWIIVQWRLEFLWGRNTIGLPWRVIFRVMRTRLTSIRSQEWFVLLLGMHLYMLQCQALQVFHWVALQLFFIPYQTLEDAWDDITCCCICTNCCYETKHCCPSVKSFCFWSHEFVPFCNCELWIKFHLSK